MTTFRFGDFEWDEAKARANLKKHGVSFSEAATSFLDPEAFTAPDKDYPDRDHHRRQEGRRDAWWRRGSVMRTAARTVEES